MLSFDLLAIFTVKCNDCILLAFLSCFLFYSLKTKIASFQLKENVVFLLFSPPSVMIIFF